MNAYSCLFSVAKLLYQLQSRAPKLSCLRLPGVQARPGLHYRLYYTILHYRRLYYTTLSIDYTTLYLVFRIYTKYSSLSLLNRDLASWINCSYLGPRMLTLNLFHALNFAAEFGMLNLGMLKIFKFNFIH